MRTLLAIAIALAGCSPVETTSTTAQALGTCGAGTHVEAGTCTADRFTIVVPRTIETSWVPVDVRVFGRMPDGSPSTETVVLQTSRPGAGKLEDPVLVLGPLGSRARFIPCEATTPGCLGPLQLTVALASAPTEILARIDVELTSTPAVASNDPCGGGGNVVYLESDDFVYPGALTIIDGTFTLTGGTQRAILDVVPTNSVQGTHWTFDFSAVPVGTQLTPAVYRYVNTSGKADLKVTGQTPYATCRDSTQGEFQVDAYVPGTTLTARFRSTCLFGDKEVRGCVHFE